MVNRRALFARLGAVAAAVAVAPAVEAARPKTYDDGLRDGLNAKVSEWFSVHDRATQFVAYSEGRYVTGALDR